MFGNDFSTLEIGFNRLAHPFRLGLHLASILATGFGMFTPMNDRGHLLTEKRNPDSMRLDAMSVEEAVDVMNRADADAVEAVRLIAADVARAVVLVSDRLLKGGRLFYFGAGTSGRLGVLDASECPPTFRTDPEMVQGVIAGGLEAMFRAKEGAEDSAEGGAKDVADRSINAADVVMGIATGGTTPYVHGALQEAKRRGAGTIFLSCVQHFPDETPVDIVLRPLTGPEVLTGSTRLKAGTATKLILNQITTLSMVRLGKVYENLMVDLRATNSKLVDRSIRIIDMICGVGRAEAGRLLEAAGGHVKLAVVMQKTGLDRAAAEQKLAQAGGILRRAIED
jgi:N-acetylmuramic acid 6-phosphate etherase